jgi:hypothetical protein
MFHRRRGRPSRPGPPQPTPTEDSPRRGTTGGAEPVPTTHLPGWRCPGSITATGSPSPTAAASQDLDIAVEQLIAACSLHSGRSAARPRPGILPRGKVTSFSGESATILSPAGTGVCRPNSANAPGQRRSSSAEGTPSPNCVQCQPDAIRPASPGGATGTSAAWRVNRRESKPGAARTRGRSGSDPHWWRGRRDLIDPDLAAAATLHATPSRWRRDDRRPAPAPPTPSTSDTGERGQPKPRVPGQIQVCADRSRRQGPTSSGFALRALHP